MNIFDFPNNDYLYLLSMAGDDIYINNGTIPKKALINNLPVNRQADIRTIATKEEIKRGDLINWDNEYWLIISEIGQIRTQTEIQFKHDRRISPITYFINTYIVF